MTKLWGGRFKKKIHPLADAFTKSIQFDQKLAFCDCWGSVFHIDVLKAAGLLTEAEHKKLHDGLQKIILSIEQKTFKADLAFEDIHSFIQHLIEKETGDVALKMHTCRSRNDQIVFDLKLYCQLQIRDILALITDLDGSLKELARKNQDVHIPGYTHLQHAIPIQLNDYLMAYSEMLKHDYARLVRLGAANATVEFRSEAARIDLNAAPKPLLAGLFRELGRAT